jgi:hypothetical protein
MSNCENTYGADWMKNGRVGERQHVPEPLKEGCLECAADVLTKVLDLSRLVPVPEELVQAAIRVFPVPPPAVQPSSAPPLPVLSPRLTYKIEGAHAEPLQVDPNADGGVAEVQRAEFVDAEVTVSTSSNR